MRYIRLTEEQLADNFERVANDSYKLIKENGLENTEVDMRQGEDKRNPDLNLCDTPACHGGWAAIMYGAKNGKSNKDFYELGAIRLAEELGFKLSFRLQWWAGHYSKYWGSGEGYYMFSSNEAFNRSFKETLHLKDIADWYMNVAKRLRGEKVCIT